MADQRTLTPRRGHYFDLSLLSLCWLGFCLVLGYGLYNFAYEAGRLGAQLTGVAMLVLLCALIVSFRPGRFVVIDLDGMSVSKPTLLRRRAPEIFSADQIQSYKMIYSVADRNRIMGILLLVKDGRKIRYSDKRTPEVSKSVLELVSRAGTREDLDGRQLVG